MGKLDGKIAVVTGGSAGMGLAAAKLFVEEGARVVITGRDRAALDAAAGAIGRNVEAIGSDMSRLGDALTRTMAPVRINYAIFGNLEPALHAHVVPRYRNEPEGFRTQHPWAYDWEQAPAFDAVTQGPLMRALRAELAHLGTLRSPE